MPDDIEWVYAYTSGGNQLMVPKIVMDACGYTGLRVLDDHQVLVVLAVKAEYMISLIKRQENPP